MLTPRSPLPSLLLLLLLLQDLARGSASASHGQRGTPRSHKLVSWHALELHDSVSLGYAAYSSSSCLFRSGNT
jgi:hypothetical protein